MRFIAIILCLLVSNIAIAKTVCNVNNTMLVTSVPVDPPCTSCGTCSGCATADILCEDWDTDNSCTWTETETGGTISVVAAHNGTWACNDKGTKTLDLLYNASPGDCYASFDMGEGKYVVYVHFSFKMVSVGSLETGNSQSILILDDSSSGTFPGVHLYYSYISAANDRLYLTLNNNTVGGATPFDFAEDGPGTKYEIGIYFLKTNDGDNADSDDAAELWVNGTRVINHAGINFTATIPRYVVISSTTENANAGNLNFQVDNIEIDDDTMPSDCP